MDRHTPSPPLTEAPTILDRSRHPISRNDIDADALKVLYRLHNKGHTAYLVGGAVRDLLLGRRPADFDISTDAHPNRIKKLFANAFLIGRRFRLAHIRFSGGKIIEVSTFRKKPEAEDESGGDTPEGEIPSPEPGEAGTEPRPSRPVRKPIAFGTPREDAFRRDITINALFYDIATFSVIDYVGGLEDLQNGCVRIIGDPDVSYAEDPVRIWRVLRHAARLGYAIEEKTGEAIARHRQLISDVPGSRLFEELNKDLKSGASMRFFELLKRYDVLPLAFGKIGTFLAKSEDHFSRLMEALKKIDGAIDAGSAPAPRILYSLFFWPWARIVLAGGKGDRPKMLLDAQREAQSAVLFPKNLLIDVFYTLTIVDAMAHALRGGQLRKSMKKRAHYEDASMVASLLFGWKPAEGQDSPDPGTSTKLPAPEPSPRRRRRRRPRRRQPPN